MIRLSRSECVQSRWLETVQHAPDRSKIWRHVGWNAGADSECCAANHRNPAPGLPGSGGDFRDGGRHRSIAQAGAQEVSPQPTKRELDILLSTGERAASALTAMAVNALGGTAISLTGAEAGILTDRNHTRARIANISPKQIHELLADDYIVIVAGFQGQTSGGRNNHAWPRRLGSDGDCAGRRVECRCLPDFHRCRWRFYLRSANCERSGKTRRNCLRRVARDGWQRRKSDAVARRGVRQEIRRRIRGPIEF